MKRKLAAAVGAIGLLAGAPPAGRVGLAEALRAAVEKVRADDARTEVAARQLRVLEAANRWKVELRPSLGLLSFSHPAILAASVGSSLFLGKRNAPSPLAMAGARFDVLEAELASERLRARTEIETARAYFELLEKQQIGSQIQKALRAKKESRSQLHELLRSARVTALDSIDLEGEMLSLEQQKVDVEMQRRVASIQLATLMGKRDRMEDLEVEEVSAQEFRFDKQLPALETLLQSALLHRREVQLLREKLQSLRTRAGLPGPTVLDSVSTGYSYLANGERGTANPTQTNLIGGHVGQLGIGLSIPLRQTGEKTAEKELLEARIRALELEARAMEDQLRSDLLSMRSVAAAATERVELATRRLELSRQKRKIVVTRVRNGLAAFASEAGAEEADRQAEAALLQAECERKNSLFLLMVLCGLQERTGGSLPTETAN